MTQESYLRHILCTSKFFSNPLRHFGVNMLLPGLQEANAIACLISPSIILSLASLIAAGVK